MNVSRELVRIAKMIEANDDEKLLFGKLYDAASKFVQSSNGIISPFLRWANVFVPKTEDFGDAIERKYWNVYLEVAGLRKGLIDAVARFEQFLPERGDIDDDSWKYIGGAGNSILDELESIWRYVSDKSNDLHDDIFNAAEPEIKELMKEERGADPSFSEINGYEKKVDEEFMKTRKLFYPVMALLGRAGYSNGL